MSALFDFSAPTRLQELIQFLTDGAEKSRFYQLFDVVDSGQLKNRFENFSIHNISTWMLEGGFPKGQMRIFGYPSANPHYVFMIEESEYQFPHVHVRTPTDGHDRNLLKHALTAVIHALTPELERNGQLMLEADTTVRAMFFELQVQGAPFDTVYSGDFFAFYMNEEQKEKIKQIDFKAPDGFQIDQINVANDYEKMHSVWPYKVLSPPEILKLRLERLPSVCVRAADGSLSSWEATHSFGQVTHLYTLEPYRGHEIGVLAENLLAQRFARSGLHVYKYVGEHNADVLRGTMRHPLWSTWTTVGSEKESEEMPIMWTFSIFKYRRAQEN